MAKDSRLKEKKEKALHEELISQMATLATSGFGLVAALAWNQAIEAFVKEYIERLFPSSTAVWSRFLYAVFITFLAVVITYQLSKLAAKIHGSFKKSN